MKTTKLHRGLRARIRSAHATEDQGFAMIVVLGVAFTMTALLATSLVYAINTGRSGPQENMYSNLAYNAAIAGVNDFTARMNKDNAYCTKSDPTNKAFTGWQRLPGDRTSAYNYKVVSDCSIATGDSSDVKLKVTGISGPRTGPTEPAVRTITAEIKRPGFRDYVFFTDKEEPDPNLAEYGLTATQANTCAKTYNWGATTLNNRPSYCTDLGFGTGDVLNGKVHTNDVITINGSATFTAGVTEGCPGNLSTDPCKTTRYINDGGTPTFASPIVPSTTLAFPETDATVQAAAEADGCVYYGPTRIVLLNTGKLSIASPGSTATVNCPIGSSVDPPHNGVIYVTDIPTTSAKYNTTCPTAPWVTNATTGSSNSGGTSFPLANDFDTAYMTCNDGNIWIEGVANGIFVVGSKQDIFITGDITYAGGLSGASADDAVGLVAQNTISFYHPVGTTTTQTAAGFCKRVLVRNNASVKTAETTEAHCEGTKMKFTSANANTIKDTTNATCTTTNTNTNSTSYCNVGAWTDPTYSSVTGELCANPCGRNLTVNAAMLAISHSIRVPYYNKSYTSDLGTLTINGSLAQYFRGPVRQTSGGTYRGYTKTYNYDARLKNIVLPGFPQPTSEYGSSQYTENKPAVSGGCFTIGTEAWRTTSGC